MLYMKIATKKCKPLAKRYVGTVSQTYPVKRLLSNTFRTFSKRCWPLDRCRRSNGSFLIVAQNMREDLLYSTVCIYKSRKIFCCSFFYPINQVTIATRLFLYVTKILYGYIYIYMILKLFYKVQIRKFTIHVLSVISVSF